MMHTDTKYDLINSLTGVCNYWEGLFGRGSAHTVLTTVDPWREYKESHQDLYRYIAYINTTEEEFE